MNKRVHTRKKRETLDMDCKVGSEHSLWNPPPTSIAQLFKEKRIWAPNPGEDCIRGRTPV